MMNGDTLISSAVQNLLPWKDPFLTEDEKGQILRGSLHYHHHFTAAW